MYKPTKKTLYILIACILAVSSIYIAKNQTTKTFGLVNLETSSGTSTKNLSQNNETSTNSNVEAQTTNTTAGNENLTESFSKSLFAKYYTANGNTGINEADSQSLINEAVEAYKSLDLGNTAHYALGDLKILSSTDENLRNFINSFVTKEETCIYNVKNTAKTTEDPIKTGNLYKKCADELSKIPITQELNMPYLSLLNAHYLMGEKIYALEEAKADPLKALAIIKQISEIEQEKTALYQNISDFIKKSGIIFTTEEAGSKLVEAIQ
jgi:hypothetical protein